MNGTYKAVEVSAPGVLRVVERQVSEPGAGQVRIRVEACGICHTDAATVTATYPGLALPRVPGHEVVGRIDALGRGVSRWKIGQRVGVGLIAGEDGVCESCRRGDIVNCQNAVTSGVTVDGGYAVYPTLSSSSTRTLVTDRCFSTQARSQVTYPSSLIVVTGLSFKDGGDEYAIETEEK
jgi:D-arabinose 1-dehydrogenase-like Zn-dependent alcohol dehydrogenase